MADEAANVDALGSGEEAGVEPHDPVLASLTDLLNTVGKAAGSSASAGVILMIGGSLYAADIVSAQAWWEESAVRARRATAGGVAEAAEAFAQGLASQFTAISEMYQNQDLGQPMGYAHLKNVRPIGAMMVVDDLSMRVRLDQIQAWTVGRPS
jgi:hypothetical protein